MSKEERCHVGDTLEQTKEGNPPGKEAEQQPKEGEN
jgi:hypothetical protein